MNAKRDRRTSIELPTIWEEDVGVYTHCPAIQWKASQKKDEEHVKNHHGEDGLTWQAFRSLETAGLPGRFVEDLLGILDQYRAYYRQRPWHQYVIDPSIDQALAEVEPDKRLARAGHLVLRD